MEDHNKFTTCASHTIKRKHLKGNDCTSQFAKICNLTLSDIKTLEQDYSIKTLQDIAILEKEDFDQIFGDDKKTFLKRRRLCHAALYLRRGGVVDNSTTMSTILNPMSRSHHIDDDESNNDDYKRFKDEPFVSTSELIHSCFHSIMN